MTEAVEAPNGPISKRGGLISEKESSINVHGVRGSENMLFSKGLERTVVERARPRESKSNASGHVMVNYHQLADREIANLGDKAATRISGQAMMHDVVSPDSPVTPSLVDPFNFPVSAP